MKLENGLYNALFGENEHADQLLDILDLDRSWVPTKSIIKVGTYEKFRERYLEYYSYMHKEE